MAEQYCSWLQKDTGGIVALEERGVSHCAKQSRQLLRYPLLTMTRNESSGSLSMGRRISLTRCRSSSLKLLAWTCSSNGLDGDIHPSIMRQRHNTLDGFPVRAVHDRCRAERKDVPGRLLTAARRF
jgi:hypothetical protein